MAPHFETEDGEKIGFYHNSPKRGVKGEKVAAQAQHDLAERWVKMSRRKLVEVADGRGDPCENLPHSYPVETSG